VSTAAWREANRERLRAHYAVYRAAWRAANRERLRAHQNAYQAAYRAANRERVNANQAAYRATRPRVSIGDGVVRISTLPEELRPIALLIRETRKEIRERSSR